MRTRAETLRWGSVGGSGRAPIRCTPAVPRALGPTATEDKASSSLVTSGCRTRSPPSTTFNTSARPTELRHPPRCGSVNDRVLEALHAHANTGERDQGWRRSHPFGGRIRMSFGLRARAVHGALLQADTARGCSPIQTIASAIRSSASQQRTSARSSATCVASAGACGRDTSYRRSAGRFGSARAPIARRAEPCSARQACAKQTPVARA